MLKLIGIGGLLLLLITGLALAQDEGGEEDVDEGGIAEVCMAWSQYIHNYAERQAYDALCDIPVIPAQAPSVEQANRSVEQPVVPVYSEQPHCAGKFCGRSLKIGEQRCYTQPGQRGHQHDSIIIQGGVYVVVETRWDGGHVRIEGNGVNCWISERGISG